MGGNEHWESKALDKFINELTSYLLSPQDRNEFKDDSSRAERGSLKEMQTFNKDPYNPRVIRVQDKGSRFVVDWKSGYKSKTMEYLQDETTFRQTEDDPNKLTSENVER